MQQQKSSVRLQPASGGFLPFPALTKLLDDGMKRVVAGISLAKSLRDQDAPDAAAQIIQPVPVALLRAEVDALPQAQRLTQSGQFSVYFARAGQFPWCLQEIGRLRELAFRAAGEGTGKASDMDVYDSYYLHIFVWDAEAAAIVGAYRLGLADEILSRYGKSGLYTHSLFQYGTRVLRAMGPAIELGRSFVRTEYQRSYAPLMLLWRGIGEFVVRSPRYAVLFGAVSISNDYQPASRRLIVDYLTQNSMEATLARHVRPRSAFRCGRMTSLERAEIAALNDIEDVSRLVRKIERDSKGVPILLKQYLKLGGRLLAFSADKRFNDALDGLIMVDLRKSDPGMTARYLGEAGAAAFRAHHEISNEAGRHAPRTGLAAGH